MLSTFTDEDRERDPLRGRTIAEVVDSKDIEKRRDNLLELSYGGIQQSFWEGARADFNGDGVEDIFVMTGGRAEGGTMGYSDYLILTRTSATDPLKLVKTSEP